MKHLLLAIGLLGAATAAAQSAPQPQIGIGIGGASMGAAVQWGPEPGRMVTYPIVVEGSAQVTIRIG